MPTDSTQYTEIYTCYLMQCFCKNVITKKFDNKDANFGKFCKALQLL